MEKNKNYRLYPAAVKDLEHIYLYSLKEFGSSKAAGYIKEIERCFQTIANEPEISRRCDNIHAQLKATNVSSHVIFFKTRKYGVAIIRVLHKSMDSVRHL